MGALLLKPDFVELLHRQGLREFGDFFRVSSGQAVSSHPVRNCVQIDIGSVRAFLKREHFVPLKHYFESWWAGFGLVSKSRREWNALHAVRRRGIRCPEPLAVGTSHGRAFLLVRALPESVDLRTFLLSVAVDARDRAWLAALVGKTISDLHAAGFTHPDLYAKHLFVDRQAGAISFVDFQRTIRRRRLSWRRRWRDLATLHASLGDDVVSPRERLRCLLVYIRHAQQADAPGRPRSARQRRRLLRQAVRAIERRARRLLRQLRIRWMREPDGTRPGSMVIEYWRVAVGEIASNAVTATPTGFGRSHGGPSR